MRRAIAWAVGAIVVVHGLIHLLGAVKGFGWTEVAQLAEPIAPLVGAVWLGTAVTTVLAGLMMASRARGWWVVAGCAAVLSQAVIFSSWSDAKAGTAVNVLLLMAALWGVFADGPASLRATYRRTVDATQTAALAQRDDRSGMVTEDDLASLPLPVASYVQACGALGRAHVVGFTASIAGRIRNGPDTEWMRFRGVQVNTFGVEPSRVFFMDATMKGLPADVLHTYVGAEARMRVRAASAVRIIDVSGPEMTQAETVTLLNDLLLFAPAAIVDAPITWTEIDDRHMKATFTNAGHTVSAVLAFDDSGRLVDFVSDDRLALSQDGHSVTACRWSTPVREFRTFQGRQSVADGIGRWHPTDGLAFNYLEMEVEDVTYLEMS